LREENSVKRFLATVSFAVVMVGVPLQANVVTNGSFETPATAGSPSLPAGSTYLLGWTVVNAELAQIRNGDFGGVFASSGTYSLDLTGYHDSSPYGGVTQTLTTIPGGVYSVQFDVGSVSGTATVQITAGDLIATQSSSNVTATDSWQTYSGFFTASAPTTDITLLGLAASAGGVYIGLDNVVVNFDHQADAPEPSALYLSGFGGLGLLLLRRRRAR
jgi:hypothetical protein